MIEERVYKVTLVKYIWHFLIPYIHTRKSMKFFSSGFPKIIPLSLDFYLPSISKILI